MKDKEPAHLHSLDIARGIAAFAVILYHWNTLFLVGSKFPEAYRPERQPAYAFLRVFYEHGHAAVSLFFSLSGLIFFRFFARRVASGSLRLGDFFVHRVSRLYPLHLATLLIVAAGQAVYHARLGEFFGIASNTPQDFVLNLFMLSSISHSTGLSFNGPSWTVSVEMLLYAIFFLYCSLTRLRMASMAVLAFVGFVFLGPLRSALGSAVGSFFLGGCLSVAYEYVTRSANRSRYSLVAILIAVILWIAAWAIPSGTFGNMDIVSPPGGGPDLATVMLFPLTILALTLAEHERPDPFRRLANATRLGPLSYSVYLLHFPLQLVVVIATTTLGISSDWFYSPTVLIAFLAVLIGTALLSHFRFEMPVQRWLRARFVWRGNSA